MSFAIYGEVNDMKLAATMGGGALSGPNAPVSPDPFYGVPAEAQRSETGVPAEGGTPFAGRGAAAK